MEPHPPHLVDPEDEEGEEENEEVSDEEIAQYRALLTQEMHWAKVDMGLFDLSSLDSLDNVVRLMQQPERRRRWMQSDVTVVLPFTLLDRIARDNRRRDNHSLTALRAFVTLFGPLPGIRCISCTRCLPERWEPVRGNDDAPFNGDEQRWMDGARELDRFFGSVLPRHPAVTRICLTDAYLPTNCFRLFTEGVASAAASGVSTLRELHLGGTFLGVEGGRLLGIMLGGGNREGAGAGSQGMSLNEVRIEDCELGPDGLQYVCEGVGRMTRLDTLNVHDPLVTIVPGTIVAAVITTTADGSRQHSNVKALEISKIVC